MTPVVIVGTGWTHFYYLVWSGCKDVKLTLKLKQSSQREFERNISAWLIKKREQDQTRSVGRMWGTPCLHAAHSHDDSDSSSLSWTLTARVSYVLLSFESYSETMWEWDASVIDQPENIYLYVNQNLEERKMISVSEGSSFITMTFVKRFCIWQMNNNSLYVIDT